MSEKLTIGDPIKVQLFMRTPGGQREEWRAATVCSVSPKAIGAAFADGMRLAIPKGQGRVKRA
jgi:hypothetical protein